MCRSFILLPFSLLVLRAQVQTAPQIRAAGLLELHRSIERTLPPGTTDLFLVAAQAGQFFHVVVEQKGADVVLAILSSSGQTLAAMDSPTHEFGFEHASTIAGESGTYQVRAFAKPGPGVEGAYRIELVAIRSPLPEDHARLRAEQLLFSAMRDERSNQGALRQRAIETYHAANNEWRRLKEPYEEALGWQRIGVLQSTNGDKQTALVSLAEAMRISRAIGNRYGEAAARTTIGLVHADLGEEAEARESAQQAWRIYHALGDRRGEAIECTNLGNIYATLGDGPEALRQYQQALDLMGNGDYPAYEGVTRNNIGNVYLRRGEYDTALRFYRDALKLRIAAHDTRGRATTLNNIAVVYARKGDHQGSLPFYADALAIRRETGDISGEAVVLNNIGRAYADLGRRQDALACYERVLPMRRATSDRFGEAATLSNLQDLYASSQPDLAIVFGKQAINTFQSIRRDNRALEQRLQQGYDKSVEAYYRSVAEVLIRRGRFAEAEEALNLLKETEVAGPQRDSVSDQLRAVTLLDEEKQVLAGYDRNVDQLVLLGQRDAVLLAKKAQGLTEAELLESRRVREELNNAGVVLHRFFDLQEKEFGARSVQTMRIGQFREAAGLQETLRELGPDVVAIYTLVAPHRYIAMLVTSGTPKAYTFNIDEPALNDMIFEFRRQLESPASDPLPLARKLYGIVFPERLRADLDAMGARTIMWSMDSTLRYIPISALYDGTGYLVNRFRNSLITPASLTRLNEQPAPQEAGIGFGVSEGIRPLPAVPGELKAIFREGPDGPGIIPGVVRLNRDFTRERFEDDLRRRQYSVVHIATHFDSRPGAAANSRLVLGDGMLSLEEIRARTNLFDHVGLLTLSACNTAFSDHNEDGREVDSFGAIAQQLGARSVIASLWSVNDPATSRLMEQLYRLRQAGLAKTEALRQAQEALLSGAIRPDVAGETERGVRLPSTPAATGWEHPFYWAPFILIGNWK